jgi:hypothetical protein
MPSLKIARCRGDLAMTKSSDDTVEIDLSFPATQPPSVDPAVLRRAMKYGQKVRSLYPTQAFWDVEPELRAGWVKKGETTEWDWIRAAVLAGFNQDSPNDD